MTVGASGAKPAIAWGPLTLATGAVTLVLVAFSARYGYHRDELYFIAAGHHPAWGYPDQPPLTPLLARLMDDLGGGSLVVLRLPATLAAAAVTLLSGLMARELGGRRFAQVLAALTSALSTYVLISGHLLVTSTVDLLVWVTITWLVLRILAGADPRQWLLVGLVAGAGLLNKQLPVVLLMGLVVGLLLTPGARPQLRSPWIWAGGVIAAAMWAPVLVWQAQHDWPQFTLAGQIREEYGALDERIGFVVLQLGLFSAGAGYLWITGFNRLRHDAAWTVFRVFVWTWLFVIVFFVATAGQAYYPGGTYPVLIAAGCVVVERRSRRWPVVAAVAASSLLMLPVALPVLSPVALGGTPWAGLGETQLETVGWPELTDLVAEAYATIPADQRARAGIVTNNYGEAGAIDRYGGARGLPRAWSGHNGYGLWGPPPDDMAPLVVVWERPDPSVYFDGCELFADVDGPVANEESQHASVYLCRGPVDGWAATWSRLVFLAS